MYKQASRMQLRFPTEKGLLTTEQLWDCSRAMLGRTIKELYNHLEDQRIESDDLDFLTDDQITEPTDPENELRFKILKDVFLTKREEADIKRDEAKVKSHNEKIDMLIAKKQDEELESLSLEDLEKLRK